MPEMDPLALKAAVERGEWLTPGQVATLLGVSRKTADRMLTENPPTLRYRVRPGTGRYRECHPADVRREYDGRSDRGAGSDMRASQPRPVALYRYFDTEGTLLYVGISESPALRAAAHAKKSSWMQFAASRTEERLADRAAAEAAERIAIEGERPLFNGTHNDSPEAIMRAVRYLIDKDRLDLLRPSIIRA